MPSLRLTAEVGPVATQKIGDVYLQDVADVGTQHQRTWPLASLQHHLAGLENSCSGFDTQLLAALICQRGSLAVGLCNRDTTAQTVSVTWVDLGLTGKQRVRDLWRQKDVGVFADKFETTVPRYGVALIRIWKEKAQ